MQKKFKVIFLLLFVGALALLVFSYVGQLSIPVLEPKGMIAAKELDLLWIATLLMMIIVVPVFILTIFISWKYRAGNKAEYHPKWDFNLVAESIWWGLPFIIIVILSVITYRSCHELDPYRPIRTGVKPIKIQVVALQWKWLFIYPEQQIASVNFVQFPIDTPIDFEITSDAPMNSFWIPQLSGQVYAMSGMITKLHVIANEIGQYRGSSANISGRGFSGMVFAAKSTTDADFESWVHSVRETGIGLDLDEYNRLIEPSTYNPASFYVLQDSGLYNYIVMKYMKPNHE